MTDFSKIDLAILAANKAATANKSSLNRAQKTGSTVVRTNQNTIAALGNYAQTPQQLANSGMVKIGSDRLIQSLISSGKTLPKSMTSNMFTGRYSINDLRSYISNPSAQTSGVTTNLLTAKEQLTNSGEITGDEPINSIGGVIYATANSGLENTRLTLKTIVNSTTPDQGVIFDIGTSSVSLGTSGVELSGSSGLNFSVNSLNSDPSVIYRDLSERAVASITNGFPEYKPNIPVMLEPVTEFGINYINDIASGAINLPAGTESFSKFTDFDLNVGSIDSSFTSFADLTSAASGVVAATLTAINAVLALFGGRGPRPATVAVKTLTTRQPISSKLIALFGEPKIPQPDFTGSPSEAAKAALLARNTGTSTTRNIAQNSSSRNTGSSQGSQTRTATTSTPTKSQLTAQLAEVDSKIAGMKQHDVRILTRIEQSSHPMDPRAKDMRDYFNKTINELYAEKRTIESQIKGLS
jgi:hypothetical protein